MLNRVPRGYYVDPSGALKRERRGSSERRVPAEAYRGEERRNRMRRQSDLPDLDREHDELIADALLESPADSGR